MRMTECFACYCDGYWMMMKKARVLFYFINYLVVHKSKPPNIFPLSSGYRVQILLHFAACDAWNLHFLPLEMVFSVPGRPLCHCLILILNILCSRLDLFKYVLQESGITFVTCPGAIAWHCCFLQMRSFGSSNRLAYTKLSILPLSPALPSDQLIVSYLPVHRYLLPYRIVFMHFYLFVLYRYIQGKSIFDQSNIYQPSFCWSSSPLFPFTFPFFSFPQWSAQCKHKLNCVMWTKANKHSSEQHWRFSMKRRWHTKREEKEKETNLANWDEERR